MTRSINKTASVAKLDAERRIAVGIVLEPWAVDRQGDWIQPEPIEQMADDYMARLQDPDGEAEAGVMHTVFPEDASTLVENRVLDEPETIGDREYPAGTWVVGRKYHDDELWQFVEDGTLAGFSIGGQVRDEEQSVDDVPDRVDVGDHPEGEPVFEITDGSIREISDVDIPAVPGALHQSYKADADDDRLKNLFEQVGGEDEFVEWMSEERGHDEDRARDLWVWMLERAAGDGTAATATEEHQAMDDLEDEDVTFIQRLRKAVSLGGGSGDDADDADAEKAGRTLSSRNRDALMASIDAQLDVLSDAGIEHGMQRFTDREDVSFDLAEYGKAAAVADLEGSSDALEGADDPDGKAADADADDTTETDTMEDDPIKALLEDEKSLEDVADEYDVDASELAEKFGGAGESDEEADEQAEKTIDVSVDEDVMEKIEALEERVEEMAKATGTSQQASVESEESDDDVSKADILGLPGGDN